MALSQGLSPDLCENRSAPGTPSHGGDGDEPRGGRGSRGTLPRRSRRWGRVRPGLARRRHLPVLRSLPGRALSARFLKENFVFILLENRGFCGQWSQIQAGDTVHSPGNVLSSSSTALSQLCPVSDQTVLPARVSWLTPASTPPENALTWLCPEPLI